jgi:tellurite methyltransferase
VLALAFFDEQPRHQLQAGELVLNPFEQAALPYLQGHVLDCGCGLGKQARACAERGCTVLALAASESALAHLRALAADHGWRVGAR